MTDWVAFTIAGFAFAFLLAAFGAHPAVAVGLAFLLLGVARWADQRAEKRDHASSCTR